MREPVFIGLLDDLDGRIAAYLKNGTYASILPTLPDFGDRNLLPLGQREIVRRLEHRLWEAEDWWGGYDEYEAEQRKSVLENAQAIIAAYKNGELRDAALFYMPVYLAASGQESFSTVVGERSAGEWYVPVVAHGFARALQDTLSAKKTAELPLEVAYEDMRYRLESAPSVVYFKQEIAHLKEIISEA